MHKQVSLALDLQAFELPIPKETLEDLQFIFIDEWIIKIKYTLFQMRHSVKKQTLLKIYL